MRNPEQFDTLIQNATVFNPGEPPRVEDIAIADGFIVARGAGLSAEHAKQVIDASGQWAMPGLYDIHTHYDLELEVAPGLPESLRHGTTTVVIANCSLGLAFGNQRKDGADPIVDCYARVENIPKAVLRQCADKVDWHTPREYLQHLDRLNLGPNVVALYPHSMLRVEVMGFNSSISRDPSAAEVSQMQQLLKDGLAMGYAGFSTDALPFHYLANQPNCAKTIPTQFARYAEIKALTDVVREQGALWQATPPKDSVLGTLKTFLLTSGRLHGKPLKTTVVAALDVHNNRKIIRLGRLMARVLNSRWLDGRFYLQALAAPFKTWADGAMTPLAEEIPELRRLNETDLEDRTARQQILANPEFIRAFRAMWLKGKQGFSVAAIKRKWRLEDYAFNRELADMTIDVCPYAPWQKLTFAEVFARVTAVKTGEAAAQDEEEARLCREEFFWVGDEADFVLQMLRSFDTELSWYTVSANRDLHTVRELLMDPLLLPGFNDSGAHLTNMAFYDCNLRALKLAAEGGEADVAYMVKRLTRDAAEVLGVEGGTLDIGARADLILLDPQALARYDGEANVQRVYREAFQHDQLVNRSDGVVPLVMVGGQIAWQNDAFSAAWGQQKLGTLLYPQHANAAALASDARQVA
ncbi:N-acyl-D-aspartate/D-glutamate deacylase [Atopomonas hussainii]|uniref:N-acyl-D-aspartate/D-glutamate deacylase n=1 Tax=Atopomonas hussainii TaxID=1429083 RepID=A0A1H7N7H8_9GAMM|nr:amidohydrolase family protein [Atopomonas hussainii]SEL18837.1 N-acyl-D-aspartate/D-glutamate deacylase [Atopomonas hussainii]